MTNALIESIRDETLAEMAADVYAGLSNPRQKQLPPKYLYDEVGTALFETITTLPEYGLTRACTRLLRRHAGEIADRLPAKVVAELGSGSGRKTRWVLEALAARGPLAYYPVDISAAALEACGNRLLSLKTVTVYPVHDSYLAGLERVVARKGGGGNKLVLFLGSNIGNFSPEDALRFLCSVRRLLQTGDGLLLSTDLVKPAPVLVAAYDDPLGVTAAFNLNLLARLNRELGAAFDLSRFSHLAIYDERNRRVEMHLRASEHQRVRIAALDFAASFEAGETIHTESSYKYEAEEVVAMAGRAGFHSAGQWLDDEWPYAQNLWIAA